MSYDIFKFGALYLGDKAQPVPKQSFLLGDIPQYAGESRISIKPETDKKTIFWIKPSGMNLLIADRVLLANINWGSLNRAGFVAGKGLSVGGLNFRCRLLRVGASEDVPNEWDKALDIVGEEDSVWHWKQSYFWGAEKDDFEGHAVRGWMSARYRSRASTKSMLASVGFRPALDFLDISKSASNCRLDGTEFRLSSIPGSKGFCPVLQPTKNDVFADISDGAQVKMYSFMEGQHPVCIGERVKTSVKLTLTDRYFGDEFLVPWTISNGVAVASRSLFSKSKG